MQSHQPASLRVPPAPTTHQFGQQYGAALAGLPGMLPFPNGAAGVANNQAWLAAFQAQAAQVESNKGLLAAAAQHAAQHAAQQQQQQQQQQQHEKQATHHPLMGHGSPPNPHPSYPPNLPVASFGPVSGAGKGMIGDMFNGSESSPSMLKMNLEKNMMHSILFKGPLNSSSRRSPPEKAMIE